MNKNTTRELNWTKTMDILYGKWGLKRIRNKNGKDNFFGGRNRRPIPARKKNGTKF